jgi:hypothetical protein
MAGKAEVICVRRKQQYFCKGDWTGSIKLIPKENFFSAVIPGRAKHEPGIHNHRGLRQVAHPGMTTFSAYKKSKTSDGSPLT